MDLIRYDNEVYAVALRDRYESHGIRSQPPHGVEEMCQLSPSTILSDALAASTCVHKQPYENTRDCRESLAVVSTGDDAHLLRFLPGGVVRRSALTPPILHRYVDCLFLGSTSDMTQVRGWSRALKSQCRPSGRQTLLDYPQTIRSNTVNPPTRQDSHKSSTKAEAQEYRKSKAPSGNNASSSSSQSNARTDSSRKTVSFASATSIPSSSSFSTSHHQRNPQASRSTLKHSSTSSGANPTALGFYCNLPSPSTDTNISPSFSCSSAKFSTQHTSSSTSSSSSSSLAFPAPLSTLYGHGFFAATLPVATQPIHGVGASTTAMAIDAADVQQAHTIWTMSSAVTTTAATVTGTGTPGVSVSSTGPRTGTAPTGATEAAVAAVTGHRAGPGTSTGTCAGEIGAAAMGGMSDPHMSVISRHNSTVSLTPESRKPDILSARIPDATIGWSSESSTKSVATLVPENSSGVSGKPHPAKRRDRSRPVTSVPGIGGKHGNIGTVHCDIPVAGVALHSDTSIRDDVMVGSNADSGRVVDAAVARAVAMDVDGDAQQRSTRVGTAIGENVHVGVGLREGARGYVGVGENVRGLGAVEAVHVNGALVAVVRRHHVEVYMSTGFPRKNAPIPEKYELDDNLLFLSTIPFVGTPSAVACLDMRMDNSLKHARAYACRDGMRDRTPAPNLGLLGVVAVTTSAGIHVWTLVRRTRLSCLHTNSSLHSFSSSSSSSSLPSPSAPSSPVSPIPQPVATAPSLLIVRSAWLCRSLSCASVALLSTHATVPTHTTVPAQALSPPTHTPVHAPAFTHRGDSVVPNPTTSSVSVSDMTSADTSSPTPAATFAATSRVVPVIPASIPRLLLSMITRDGRLFVIDILPAVLYTAAALHGVSDAPLARYLASATPLSTLRSGVAEGGCILLCERDLAQGLSRLGAHGWTAHYGLQVTSMSTCCGDKEDRERKNEEEEKTSKEGKIQEREIESHGRAKGGKVMGCVTRDGPACGTDTPGKYVSHDTAVCVAHVFTEGWATSLEGDMWLMRGAECGKYVKPLSSQNDCHSSQKICRHSSSTPLPASSLSTLPLPSRPLASCPCELDPTYTNILCFPPLRPLPSLRSGAGVRKCGEGCCNGTLGGAWLSPVSTTSTSTSVPSHNVVSTTTSSLLATTASTSAEDTVASLLDDNNNKTRKNTHGSNPTTTVDAAATPTTTTPNLPIPTGTVIATAADIHHYHPTDIPPAANDSTSKQRDSKSVGPSRELDAPSACLCAPRMHIWVLARGKDVVDIAPALASSTAAHSSLDNEVCENNGRQKREGKEEMHETEEGDGGVNKAAVNGTSREHDVTTTNDKEKGKESVGTANDRGSSNAVHATVTASTSTSTSISTIDAPITTPTLPTHPPLPPSAISSTVSATVSADISGTDLRTPEKRWRPTTTSPFAANATFTATSPYTTNSPFTVASPLPASPYTSSPFTSPFASSPFTSPFASPFASPSTAQSLFTATSPHTVTSPYTAITTTVIPHVSRATVHSPFLSSPAGLFGSPTNHTRHTQHTHQPHRTQHAHVGQYASSPPLLDAPVPPLSHPTLSLPSPGLSGIPYPLLLHASSSPALLSPPSSLTSTPTHIPLALLSKASPFLSSLFRPAPSAPSPSAASSLISRPSLPLGTLPLASNASFQTLSPPPPLPIHARWLPALALAAMIVYVPVALPSSSSSSIPSPSLFPSSSRSSCSSSSSLAAPTSSLPLTQTARLSLLVLLDSHGTPCHTHPLRLQHTVTGFSVVQWGPQPIFLILHDDGELMVVKVPLIYPVPVPIQPLPCTSSPLFPPSPLFSFHTTFPPLRSSSQSSTTPHDSSLPLYTLHSSQSSLLPLSNLPSLYPTYHILPCPVSSLSFSTYLPPLRSRVPVTLTFVTTSTAAILARLVIGAKKKPLLTATLVIPSPAAFSIATFVAKHSILPRSDAEEHVCVPRCVINAHVDTSSTISCRGNEENNTLSRQTSHTASSLPLWKWELALYLPGIPIFHVYSFSETPGNCIPIPVAGNSVILGKQQPFSSLLLTPALSLSASYSSSSLNKSCTPTHRPSTPPPQIPTARTRFSSTSLPQILPSLSFTVPWVLARPPSTLVVWGPRGLVAWLFCAVRIPAHTADTRTDACDSADARVNDDRGIDTHIHTHTRACILTESNSGDANAAVDGDVADARTAMDTTMTYIMPFPIALSTTTPRSRLLSPGLSSTLPSFSCHTRPISSSPSPPPSSVSSSCSTVFSPSSTLLSEATLRTYLPHLLPRVCLPQNIGTTHRSSCNATITTLPNADPPQSFCNTIAGHDIDLRHDAGNSRTTADPCSGSTLHSVNLRPSPGTSCILTTTTGQHLREISCVVGLATPLPEKASPGNGSPEFMSSHFSQRTTVRCSIELYHISLPLNSILACLSHEYQHQLQHQYHDHYPQEQQQSTHHAHTSTRTLPSSHHYTPPALPIPSPVSPAVTTPPLADVRVYCNTFMADLPWPLPSS